MSNLGPYPRRMWVNQPSKDQPLHKRHGENVLAIPDFGGGAHRAYTLNPDDATSFYAPEGTLSDGWQTPKPKGAEEVTLGVGGGDGKLFVHGDGDSIRAAQRHVFRSEQLGQARDLLEKTKLYIQRRWYDLEGQNLVTDIHNFLRRVDCE